MFPSGEGGMAFLQYDYQDQNRNWSGTSQAPAANNDDKEIETHFTTLGLQYMFNRSWGVQAEVPYDFRYFKTKDDAGDIVSRNWSQLGDIRIQGHLHRILRRSVCGRNIRSEIADGQSYF